jgi:surfeit locus 1 family protein
VTRRILSFIALAALLAALYIGLGLWQLDRRAERRVQNAVLTTRIAAPVIPFEHLPGDASYRRALVTGVPDFDNEIVFTGRSRNGSPGVYILTPVRRPANDTAVLVLRGWVYAPDAATVDLARWREARTAYGGYVNALPAAPARANRPVAGRKLRSLSRSGVQALLPYPVASHYLVSQDTVAEAGPARLPMVTVNEGRHLSYAIQWFAFAAIALVGAGAVIVRERTHETLARRMHRRPG